MEIGAIATLRSAGPDGVAAAPAFAGFVIAHGGEHVVVDVTSLLDGSGIPGGVLFGKLGDPAVERNEFVGLKESLQVRIARRRSGDSLEGSRVQGNPVLAAHGRESQHHIKASCGLLRCRGEGRKRIPVFEITALDVTHGTIKVQTTNVLVAIGLRPRNPEMSGSGGILTSRNMHLIREFERASRNCCTRFRSSLAARMSGKDRNKCETHNR